MITLDYFIVEHGREEGDSFLLSSQPFKDPLFIVVVFPLMLKI